MQKIVAANPVSSRPENLPEALVWYSIIGTYLLYILGAQYLCATFLAFFLTFYLIKKWWDQNEETPIDEQIFIPTTVWIWIITVLVVGFALIVAHSNFDLGMSQTIKSLLNWSRNWGSLALFPLIGCLNIRPQIISRAICILCIQSLLVLILCTLAQLVKFPIISYVSPLKIFGGVGDSYTVYLFYVLDENQPRLQLFAPWPPALGLVGSIHFFLAKQDVSKKLRIFGMIGAVAMIFGSVSRLAMICLPTVTLLTWLLTNLLRPRLYFLLSSVSVAAGILSSLLLQIMNEFKDQFNQARSGSSAVRTRLREMADEAWREAPIWGHGRLEPKGPSVVAFKSIGSHHFWYGTLYSYGLVGTVATGIAFLWSFLDLLIKAQLNELNRVGLSIFLAISLFTIAENIEGLAYICWPGLIMLGIAFKQKLPPLFWQKIHYEVSQKL
jgi:hypothetical protein